MARITTLLFHRDSLHRSMCPTFDQDEETRRETLKRISVATKEVKVLAFKLVSLERNHYGFTGVLNRQPSELETLAMTLLTVARVDGNCSREVGVVSDVVTLCSSRRIEDTVEVRSFFRSDGSLNKLVVMSGNGMPLDERRAVLKEGILNQILSLTPDAFHETIALLEWRR